MLRQPLRQAGVVFFDDRQRKVGAGRVADDADGDVLAGQEFLDEHGTVVAKFFVRAEDRRLELLQVVADVVDRDAEARIADVRLDDDREWEAEVDERAVAGFDQVGAWHRQAHLVGDTAHQRLVIAVGEALRGAAGVGDTQDLEQGCDVELFDRIVLKALIAQVEDEIAIAPQGGEIR